MKHVPKWANSNSKLPIVGKTKGYENQTVNLNVSSGAENATLYSKLKSSLVGKEISDGHAFSKHVIKQGEFKNVNITTREQFEKHIEDVVNNYTSFKRLSNGRVRTGMRKQVKLLFETLKQRMVELHFNQKMVVNILMKN
ncbi:hypothetical protein E5343_11730 [Rodentibacter caecimuris]|uniref:hypothetical protein n=1 Tax=Rodentibacter caecimuris TaxID=1796644 RepID=UPI001094D763|nr:hypothetical protein [Pasteurella caecimuris]MCR1837459.1 hypothetical protein [Pasteurella caecimuris]MCU0106904.1 hypothetical protein [Pasteurella caecimuris]TGY47722.1 hypothetical protein E5343_11730 [Pasteurella caecimuris]